MDGELEFDYGRHWAIGTEPYDPSLQRYIREPLPSEPTYDLCKVCSSIDFDAIKAIDYTSAPARPEKLTPVFIFPEKHFWDSSCPFCRLMIPFQKDLLVFTEMTLACWELGLLEPQARQETTPDLVFVGATDHHKLYTIRNELLLYRPAKTAAKQCALESPRHLHDSWMINQLDNCQTHPRRTNITKRKQELL